MINNEFYDKLDPVCHAGLKASLNQETHAYDLQLKDKAWHNTNEFYPTEDLTSSAICLIGINRARVDLSSVALDPSRVLDSLYGLYRRRNYPGGFGLVLWAAAVWDGPDFDAVQQRCDIRLHPFSDHVASITTMEAAWLASGLATEYQRNGNEQVKVLLEKTAAELMQSRFEPTTGLVIHAGKMAGFSNRLRGHIANFADQIYTIQALAFTSMATGNEQALDIAIQLADNMVKLQGDKGQWWWHYDASRGGVPQQHPVYSVHQHGMAPMALRAINAAGGPDFEEAIVMSRSWMDNNELGISLIDTGQPTIWRSIEHDDGMAGNMIRKLCTLLGLAGDRSSKPALRLNYETRPYEWAWCIYAGGIERAIDKGLHLV